MSHWGPTFECRARACLHGSERARLGVRALERAGRAVGPEDELTIRCRMSTGGGGVTAS